MTTPNRWPVHSPSQRKVPDRLYMEAPHLTLYQARQVAMEAVAAARRNMPKVTGSGARSLRPLYGEGYFGITWADDYVWWQEVGINPFTMTRLAGKLIPMWITDVDGSEQRKNPKAKTRVTQDGRTQVLIFRRAAKIGATKTRTTTIGSTKFTVTSPAAYPGAPGRISNREVGRPHTRPGKVGGAIARPNVGVRWRHPGLSPRSFLHWGMVQAAQANDVPVTAVYATNERWR